MDVIVEHKQLPSKDFEAAWDAIKLDASVKERLVAQAVLSLQMRQKFSFEQIPMHGLILMSGPPGTGKTTLARGLADRIAKVVGRAQYVQLDAHALGSSSLGKSQKEVSKIFSQTIPELAMSMPAIVLLDEVETLAADRQKMSLEANPIDAHRATDAALAGIDLLTRKHRNTLLIATTNYPKAVDRALLSRADWIEEIGPPGAEARKQIILEVLELLGREWPKVGHLRTHIAAFVAASEGMDGRRLRKALTSAGAISIETAKDLNKLTRENVLETLSQAAEQPDLVEAA
ncbi:AAA family ATPase [Pseudaminobacter sp. 19-2017]|uniref:AAA family ATPase n=1 Tax=Pseudaminobacter soli (ex Zhang et al. 2022) TaxID=2831468 RepID=A0A942E2W3_9HYPH|nr:AAA family ATPase [Pseudaminobacter soli]MBS3651952.1 AAA family ATPase [Pseudaminobacter soli]